jgi:prepilin-type N-terminal cleavage/methylation domain-containing protein
MTTWWQAISNNTRRVVVSYTAQLNLPNRGGPSALMGKVTYQAGTAASRAVLFPPPASAGFTFTELIVVLLVIGILAAVAIAKLSNINVVQQRTEYDKVISALQYARASAIAQRRYACVGITVNAVSLTLDPNPPESTATPFGGTCPFATALALPSPDPTPACASNQTCVKNTSITSTSASFQFDPRGRAPAQVVITVSGFPAITVEGETGYVH